MAIHTQVGDRLQTKVITFDDTKGVPLAAHIKSENVVEIHLTNGSQNAANIFIGDSNAQEFKLTQPLTLNITRLDQVYVRGNAGDKAVALIVRTSGEFASPKCD